MQGVDLLSVYEKDEIEWATKVELSGTTSCPAIPANLKARYRGDSAPNMSHKRMNCHLAVDALYAKYGNDMVAMPNESGDFFYDYVQAVEKKESCPEVPGETKLFAKGHVLTGVDQMYLDAANAGDSNAMLEVAIRQIRTSDFDNGYQNLFLAADMGNPWAHYEISEQYRAGAGGSPDPAKSHEHMLKSAEAGLPWAMIAAGRNYETGYGTKRNPVEAIGWYQRAAQAGHIMALPLAAAMIEKGDGVKKDRERAYELLRIGTGAGDVTSMSILGFMLLNEMMARFRKRLSHGSIRRWNVAISQRLIGRKKTANERVGISPIYRSARRICASRFDRGKPSAAPTRSIIAFGMFRPVTTRPRPFATLA